MALRIGPPPALARLRVQWHVTVTLYVRQSRAIQTAAVTTFELIWHWFQQTSERLDARLNPRLRSLALRQAKLTSFVEHYEELVDLLCCSAKDGMFTERDAKYAELRRWLQLNYHRNRRDLRRHLGEWSGPLDPFEEMFAPESIEIVINGSGSFHNMMQTRTALDAYCSELHSLSSRRR